MSGEDTHGGGTVAFMMSHRVPALAIALAAVLLAGLAVLAIRNLGYRGMWWDEASQFWMSQGLSRYSPPFAARQGLVEVARWNAWENLDPGGFSVLLHEWTLASCGLVWLRLLPFSFFLLGALALALLGWRLTRSFLFAVASGAAPLLYPAALYFALEIRAYSTEMAGIAIGALLLTVAVEWPSTRRAALLGLACAGFMTSRYSFVLAAAALIVALFGGSVGHVTGRTLRANLVAAIVPILIVGAAIAGIMLPHQLWPEMRAGALGLSSPVYTHQEVLRFAPDAPTLLARNLISPAALPITLAVLLFVVLGIRKVAHRADHPIIEASVAPASVRFALFSFVAVLQVLSAVVSLLGLYPWNIASRWSAYLVALSAVAAVALAAEIRGWLLGRIVGRADTSALLRRLRRLGAAFVVLVVLAAALRAGLHRQIVVGQQRANVALQIDRLSPTAFAPGRVFVTWYEVPMVRYLYEYGPYAGRAEYPASFRFETLAELKAGAPIPAAREGIEFIITALPIDQARARFSGCVLRPYGPPGNRLLAVQPVARVDPAPN